MSGAAPLTYTTIESWQRLRQIGNLDPEEVEALILLDAALLGGTERQPEEEGTLPKKSEAPRKPRPAWPDKKE